MSAHNDGKDETNSVGAMKNKRKAPKIAYYDKIIESEKGLYVLASEVPEIKEDLGTEEFETLKSICRKDNFFLGVSCAFAYCFSFGLDQYLRLKNPIIGLTYQVTLPSVFLKFNIIPALVVFPYYFYFVQPKYSAEISKITGKYDLQDGKYKKLYEEHMLKTRNWIFLAD